MAFNRASLGNHNNYNVLATAHIVKPLGEKSSIFETYANSYLVRFSKSLSYEIPILGQEIRMIFGYLSFPFSA